MKVSYQRELRDRYVYPVADNVHKYLVLNHATYAETHPPQKQNNSDLRTNS